MASVHRAHIPADFPHRLHPFVDDAMDVETAALIAKFALEDLEEAASAGKGKSRADVPLSDAEYAYQLQSQNYQQWLSITADAMYAHSLDSAMATDAAFLEAAIVAEAATAADRRVAEMLSRGEELPPQTAAQARMEQPGFTMHPEPPASPMVVDVKGKTKAFGIHMDLMDVENDVDSLDADMDFGHNVSMFARYGARHVKADSASGSGPSSSQNTHKTVHCVICQDSIKSNLALHASCNHYYCSDCVISLVENFTRDESLFPLRCCKEPIPITKVDAFIDPTLRALFLQKHTEFSVLAKDRVYCVSSACSVFLGSAEGIVEPGIVCHACETSTCPRCKQAEHAGADCAANTAIVELRAIGRTNGWQTCLGCHALVELSHGCYHMTCRCRAEFCYLCAVPWKNCDCTQWDENLLLEAAQQRHVNQHGARGVGGMAPDVWDQGLQELQDDMRNDHECDRHVWKQRPGGGFCEECNWEMRDFLKICRNCSMLVCVRCSRNRL